MLPFSARAPKRPLFLSAGSAQAALPRGPSALGLALGLCVGCASACAKVAPYQAESHAPAAERRAAAPALDTTEVSGLHGTLSQEEIQRALTPRLPKFLRCATARRAELEVLAGNLTFGFHLAANGLVTAVQVNQSTLGDRASERCMVEVAQSTQFPPPHGGEADFTWPLELPPDTDVRAPVQLGADVAQPISSARPARGIARGETLQGVCGGGQYVVTAYLGPDGRVLAAGVATPDISTPTELDCVAAGVMDWSFPSPGSYTGKLSFTVP